LSVPKAFLMYSSQEVSDETILLLTMNYKLTDQQRSLSKKYIAYSFLTNLFFMAAVWLYFYRLFVTDQQVGIIDGLAFAVGLIAEVPSGALADRFGRDKLVKVGHILTGIGLLMQAFGSSFAPFLGGQVIMMIGISFVSGADEALFFAKLNFDRASAHWRKLVTRETQAGMVAILCATVIGGWLHTIHPRVPWILTGLAFFGAAFVVWGLRDERRERATQTFGAEFVEHVASIRSGFREFFTPRLLRYVPIILVLQGLFYAVGWGLLRLILLDRFHFGPFAGSVVVATSSLLTVGVLSLMHRQAESMREQRVVSVIAIAAAASLVVSIADIGIWGALVIFALYAGAQILAPFMSEILNNRAPEEERATVLSVASFLRTLPYVALAPLIGYLNTQGKLEYFLITWPVLIVAAVLTYFVLKPRDVFDRMGE